MTAREHGSRDGEGLAERLRGEAKSLRKHADGWGRRWAHSEAMSCRSTADLLDAAASALSETRRTPDGYAVVMAEGYFVGIWRDRESAEKILGRSPMAKGERIEPMCFLGTNRDG